MKPKFWYSDTLRMLACCHALSELPEQGDGFGCCAMISHEFEWIYAEVRGEALLEVDVFLRPRDRRTFDWAGCSACLTRCVEIEVIVRDVQLRNARSRIRKLGAGSR